MRAGRLRTPAILRTLTTELAPLWVGISAKEETQEPETLPGVLTRSNVTIRAHYRDDVAPGLYLMAGGDAYLINSARDPDGRRRDLLISASLITGTPAEYAPLIGPSYSVPVTLTTEAPYVGDYARAVEYRRIIEVARIHLREYPRKGDAVTLNGATWTVQGLVDGGDDGVIVRLWVKQ